MEELVVKMRRHRMGLIQTPQQLQFCWKTIAEALKMQRDSERSSKANEPSKAIDPRPTCIIANTGRGDGPPHLERSAANQMTSGQHAKSLTDISGTIRKRSSGEQCESEEDAKYARRFVCFVSFLLSYTSPTDRMHKPSKYGILFSTVGSWSGVCRRGFDIFLFFPHNVSRRKG